MSWFNRFHPNQRSQNPPDESESDSSLRQWLQSNEPVPPAAKAGELKTLLEKLDLKPRSSWQDAYRFLFGASSFAAGFFAAVVLLQQGNTFRPMTTSDWSRTEPIEFAAFAESDGESEELPSMEVGEEYLVLVASKQ